MGRPFDALEGMQGTKLMRAEIIVVLFQSAHHERSSTFLDDTEEHIICRVEMRFDKDGTMDRQRVLVTMCLHI